MGQDRAEATRTKLIHSATDLVRRQGYTGTSVDDICKAAGITKGAFFHHYPSKEALIEACLGAWRDGVAGLLAKAPFTQFRDPRKMALGFMDFFIGMFAEPGILKSCLAGTTVQEASETHPRLREAANVCFVSLERYFQRLLDAATEGLGRNVDTASLAAFWVAAMQGSLILYKASRDEGVIPRNLTHARDYIASQLPEARRKAHGNRTSTARGV